MVKRILALDPGGTTGWTSWTENTGLPNRGVNLSEWNFGHLGPGEHHLRLDEFLGDQQVEDFTVVCESFEFRQHDDFRSGVVLDSKEYIGVLKRFRQERMDHLGQKMVFQTAGLAKGFIPDKAKNGLEANAKLKAIGLYNPGMKHTNDATRHLVYYMVNKLKRYDLIEAWKDL